MKAEKESLIKQLPKVVIQIDTRFYHLTEVILKITDK